MIPISDLIGDVWSGVIGWTLPDDLQGWNSDHPIFDQLVEALEARIVVEVGSWKGRSAIHLAHAMKRVRSRVKGFDAQDDREVKEVDNVLFPLTLYCIDTWQGGIDHLLSDLPHDQITRENGYPTMYRQFLVNCLRADVDDLIQPLPMPSSIGLKLLAAHGVVVDLGYVDGDHTHDGAYADMQGLWPLIRPGGAMFGDDVNMPGVQSAVARFMDSYGISTVDVPTPFWVIHKPTAAP